MRFMEPKHTEAEQPSLERISWMAYPAEIRSMSDEGDIQTVEPRSIRVQHHRSGRAELRVDKLSGGHMLHLALAGCVFNNLYAFAQKRGVRLSDASVTVDGAFNDDGTASTGITCQVVVAGEAKRDDLAAVTQEAFAESSIAAGVPRRARRTLSHIGTHPIAPTRHPMNRAN